MTDEKQDAILAQLVECVEIIAAHTNCSICSHVMEARRLLKEAQEEAPPLGPPMGFVHLPD